MVQKFISTILLLIFCGSTFACHGSIIATGITQEEKQIILQEHNRLRQLVATGRYPGQPGAENMREIVWDDELAARAQQWADNCQFKHDPYRTINRFTMGQNLAIIWSTVPLEADDGDFPSRIQSWFNEVQKYSFGDAWSPKTGHYSQLVWGETSLVGCGFSEYKDSFKYNKLYVCNYGPGGNIVGYNPYEVGKPACGTYGMKPSSRYSGLCAAPGSSANGIIANTIETYEYKQTNAINNKQTAFTTTLFPQPPSPSYSKQATPTVYSKTSKEISATTASGYSFGSKSQGSSTSQTTESSQYYRKYKNKLEAYKPSEAEFQRSVLKHTILRTYLNKQNNNNINNNNNNNKNNNNNNNNHNNNNKNDKNDGNDGNDGNNDDTFEESQPTALSSTPQSAVKSGWSLLTWRG